MIAYAQKGERQSGGMIQAKFEEVLGYILGVYTIASSLLSTHCCNASFWQ